MKYFLFLISVFFSCLMISCSSGENIIRIGVFEPLSGELSEGGNIELLGIEYANYVCPEITVRNRKYKIQLVVQDNESSGANARKNANRLLDQNVSMVLGTFGSSVAIPAGGVFRDRKVPCIGITCTDPEVTKDNDYYFRICYENPFQGKVLADFAKKSLNAKKAYVIADTQDNYSIGLSQQFITSFKDMDGQCYIDTFETENQDFAQFAERAQNLHSDIILAATNIQSAEKIIFSLSRNGIKCPLLSGDGWDSAHVSTYAQLTDSDVYISTFYAEGNNNVKSEEFCDGLRNWLKNNPEKILVNNSAEEISAVTAMGYDAYFTALEAVKAAGSADSEKIRRALLTVNLSGVTGVVEFRNEREALRNVAYIKHAGKSGNWKFVSVEKVK